MRDSSALAVSAVDIDLSLQPRGVPEGALVALFQPLPFLLVAGGDVRLEVSPVTKMNVYGCRPAPRAQALAFSSSTATSISERAYNCALLARDELIRDSIKKGFLEAFDKRIEHMRHRLTSCLELNGSGTEVVFSPSGTDSQLHALFICRTLFDAPVSCVVVGADQTGSGTAHTSRGRHFSNLTAQGKEVEKGGPIAGPFDDTPSIGISLFASDGTVRSESEIDAAVIEAVAEQIRMGRNIVLQAMDSSKLGWCAPSDACLREVNSRWPQAVQIVIDACQMRIGRPRLREYLNRGYVVLITGSKFFTGPAFSGASLWSKSLSEGIVTLSKAPGGLADYATCFDMPLHWTSLRAELPFAPNFGQWLRWEAALEEMRAYYALPEPYRSSTLARLADAAIAAILSSQHLELLMEHDACVGAFDEDTPATIFPFFIRRDGRLLELDEMTRIYHALNCDLSGACPDTATREERALAATPCHIGQPVKLPGGTVLRIGISARIVSEAWSEDERIAKANLRALIAQIGTVVKKIDLIVATNAHLERPSE